MNLTCDISRDARRLRRFGTAVALVLAVAVVAAAGSLAGGVATASAREGHDQMAYGSDRHINFQSKAGKCLPDATYNLRGTYRWMVTIAQVDHFDQPTQKLRTVFLRGKYRWQDCFDFFPGRGSVLRQRSRITNVRTGGRVELVNYPVHGNFGKNSNYFWGATLFKVK
jgi:hypothetical protein